MFYEIKEKRLENASHTRWWFTAALSAIIITASFVGITFWLGMTTARHQDVYVEKSPSSSSFRDYEFRLTAAAPHSLLAAEPDSSSAPSSSNYGNPAEILKTTIKNKKAKIEMVEFTGGFESSSLRPVTFNTPRSPITEPSSPVSSTTSAGTTTTTTTTTTINGVNDKITKIQMPETDLETMEQREEFRPTEILSSSSSLRKSSPPPVVKNNRYSQFQLSEGISPLAEESTKKEDFIGSVKKSEAVPPSWYDPRLQQQPIAANPTVKTEIPLLPVISNRSPTKTYPEQDDNIYDISEFSSIKPDLSTFNIKTIPAFTYLKEPLPQYESLPEQKQEDHHHHHLFPSSSVNSNEYAYYYRNTNNNNNNKLNDTFKNNNEPVAMESNDNEPINGDNDNDNDDDDSDDDNNNNNRLDKSFSSFIKRRMTDFHEWILRTSRNRADLTTILKTVNATIFSKGAGVFYGKFKEFYSKLNTTEFQNLPVANFLYPPPLVSGGVPSIFNNTNSIMSFGLLAIDLFLLHNVQQMVWNEEAKLGDEMLKDPDVLALNALFLPPEKVQQQLRDTNSRIFTTRESGKGVLHELIEFVNGGLRAVLNLSKAYKSSTANRARSSNTAGSGTTIDCIWTLYCRNLDKTAKLKGPYGFLAKMNSLGLRLMMGEFPADKAFEKLTKEYNSGWGVLNCDKLFPRCNADEAKEVVIQTALGQQQHQQRQHQSSSASA